MWSVSPPIIPRSVNLPIIPRTSSYVTLPPSLRLCVCFVPMFSSAVKWLKIPDQYDSSADKFRKWTTVPSSFHPETLCVSSQPSHDEWLNVQTMANIECNQMFYGFCPEGSICRIVFEIYIDILVTKSVPWFGPRLVVLFLLWAKSQEGEDVAINDEENIIGLWTD